MTGTVATAAATQAKTVTLDSPWSSNTPATGDWFLITFTLGLNVQNPTLNINGSGAKAIKQPSGSSDQYSTYVAAGFSELYRYDGTNYQMIGSNVQYNEITAAEIIDTAHVGLRTITGRRAEDLMVNEATKTRTLANKTLNTTNTATLKDTNFTLQDDSDATKQASFQLSNIATGTTRTFSLPNADGTVALTSDIAHAVTSGVNLVIDPSFEDTTIDRNQWWGPTDGYSTDHVRTGTHSIKLTESSDGYEGFDLLPSTIDEHLRVTPGQVFYGEIWVYPLQSIGTLDFSIAFYDSSGVNTAAYRSFATDGEHPTPVANTWTKIGGTYITAPAGYDTCEPYFEVNDDATGLIVYVDDARIADVTEIVSNTSTRISRSVSIVTTAQTLAAVANTDYVTFIGSGGAPTLPTAVGNTSKYTIKNIHTANITITTTSSQTIDGSTTITLIPNSSIDVLSDGANWRII